MTGSRPRRENRASAPGLAAALLGVFVAAPALATEIRSPVGGVFALSARTLEHWGWSGSWRYPVGAARDFAASGPGTESAYRVLRTVGGADEGTRLHQGADLGCGRGGGPVRAAAAGLVLVAERTGWNSGYGRYVVLGHRLPRGRLAYTVYGHLAEGSIPVRAGQTVAAGVRLGRIGQSGRATTPHLHFEVRMAGATDRRWEREVVVDPLEFVAARLATPCGLDTIGRYLEWAQYAGLFDGEIVPGATLSRGQWWRMLAVSSRQNLATLPLDAGALAESLIAVGVLPQEPRESPGRALEWNDFARDLARIRKLGLRLPARPMTDAGHRATCETWLGTSDPSRAGERDARRRLKHPTVAAAVLAVADLAPAQERPNSRRTRKRSGPRAVPDPAKPAAGGGRP